jgi:hypothetical protein
LKRPDAAFLVSSLSKLNLAPRHIWQPIFENLKDQPGTNPNIEVSDALDLGFKFIAYNERCLPFDNKAFRPALSGPEDAWGHAAEPSNSWIFLALAVWHDKGIVDRMPGVTWKRRRRS